MCGGEVDSQILANGEVVREDTHKKTTFFICVFPMGRAQNVVFLLSGAGRFPTNKKTYLCCVLLCVKARNTIQHKNKYFIAKCDFSKPYI